MADNDDRGTRTFDGREDVRCGRAWCQPFVDAQVDPRRFRDRSRGLAGAQERAREDGVGLDCAKTLTQFPCLLPPPCAQGSQRVGIAGVGMRMTNQIETS